ncbi:hypothetical protein DSO57_1010852 [Entomophthora muscae]|uniref:Uncharacterized protein n=1 Tax=Entomophthora muscae TaxID=34485 RepID=A0ACC2RXG8_9FUNG|nr:hypothetical protein DSO57_1010852 [Entomophthora muscae]
MPEMANVPSSRQRGTRPEAALTQAESIQVPSSDSSIESPKDRSQVPFISQRCHLHSRKLDSNTAKGFYNETVQSFDILNDDLSLVVTGYMEHNLGLILYKIFGFLTLGIGFLLGRWFPRLPIRIGARVTSLANASFVVVVNQHNQFTKVPIETRPFEGSFAQLFSEKPEYTEIKNSYSQLNSIRLFQYRFLTFVMNPETGLFHQMSNWQDNRWAKISGWHQGLGERDLKERKVFFPSQCYRYS